jgi:hypothetical protein
VPLSEKGDRKTFGRTSPTKKSASSSNIQPLLSQLKRSRSLNAADALKLLTLETSLPKYSKSFTEYNLFPEKLHGLIRQAVNRKQFFGSMLEIDKKRNAYARPLRLFYRR